MHGTDDGLVPYACAEPRRDAWRRTTIDFFDANPRQ
jgi:hypothetical protein